jgi:hypothetical protein
VHYTPVITVPLLYSKYNDCRINGELVVNFVDNLFVELFTIT